MRKELLLKALTGEPGRDDLCKGMEDIEDGGQHDAGTAVRVEGGKKSPPTIRAPGCIIDGWTYWKCVPIEDEGELVKYDQEPVRSRVVLSRVPYLEVIPEPYFMSCSREYLGIGET